MTLYLTNSKMQWAQRASIWYYIAGLLETDGSIQISYSAKQWHYEVKFSSKTNTNIIPLLGAIFNDSGISYRIVKDPSNKRATDLRISGRNQIEKFFNLLKNKGCLPIGVKYRDYLILQEVMNNPKLTDAQRLDLKKSLHKDNMFVADLEGSGRKTRSYWEKKLSLVANASILAAHDVLSEIDRKYVELKNKIDHDIKTQQLIIEPAYIAGLLDGDGGFNITFSFKESKSGKRTIDWQGNANFTAEVQSVHLIHVFLYVIQSKTALNLHRSAYQVKIRNKTEMDNLIKILNKFPLLGDYKTQCFDLVLRLRALKEQGLIKSYPLVVDLLEKVYELSSYTTSGAKRPLSLNEVKVKLKDWLE